MSKSITEKRVHFRIPVIYFSFHSMCCKKKCLPTTNNLISKQASAKAKNKQKILELLEGKEKIGNDDVEKLLKISG